MEKKESLQKLGDFMALAEGQVGTVTLGKERSEELTEAIFVGPRCQNKKVNCNHRTAVHSKKDGRCLAEVRVTVSGSTWREQCKCDGVVR